MFGKIAGAFGGLLGVAFSLFCFVMGILMLFATDLFFRILGVIVGPLGLVTGLAFLICIFLGLPFLAFQKSRPWAAVIFAISAFLFGTHLGIVSMGLIYSLWGKWPFLISTVVLPIQPLVAIVAAGIAGEWGIVGNMLVSVVVFFAAIGLEGWAERLSAKGAIRLAKQAQ